MKKIETTQSVALILRNSFGADLLGFDFADEAKLISSKHIKEGPAWLLEATGNGHQVSLVFECVTKYGYVFPGCFSYTEVSPKDKLKFRDLSGIEGVVEERDGKTVIVWG